MKKNAWLTLEKPLLLLIAALIAAPGLMSLASLLSSSEDLFPNSLLSGFEASHASTPLSWSAVFSAKYQASLADQFNREFSGRSLAITLTDEIYYRLFNVCSMSSARLVLAKDHTIFEDKYLQEYCLWRPEWEKLVTLVQNIKRLQDACEKRKVCFSLLITPSKAAVFPDLIPGRWLRRYDPRPRAYDTIMPLLAIYGIHCVDAHALIVEARDSAPSPIFPKGGTHWNQYGTCIAANAILASLQACGKAVKPIEYGTAVISMTPQGTDADVLRMMNLYFPWSYPITVMNLKPPNNVIEIHGGNMVVKAPERVKESVHPTLVMVGGSFGESVRDLLCISRQFSEIDYYLYYKLRKTISLNGQNTIAAEPVQSVDFAREIFNADCLVLEMNEQAIPWQVDETQQSEEEHHHLTNFLSDALRQLPALNGRDRLRASGLFQ